VWGRGRTCAEAVELALEPLVDLPRSLRELAEDLVGDAVDLGGAVDRRVPPHTEPVRQLAPEGGVVEARERLLVVLDEPGVER
jgi:hypothetical protein